MMPLSTTRRFLAQALLAAPSLWLLFEGTRSRDGSEVFFGALVLLGAGLLGRRNLLAHALGRGAAWAVFGPCSIGAIALAIDRARPELGLYATVAASGAALALTRPMLDTSEARAAFAPLAFRRLFALSASAAVACGMCVATLAIENASERLANLTGLAGGVGLPLLAASLFASAVGVLRMRAWGVLLGALSGVLALAIGSSAHDVGLRAMIASTALPGALMVGAVLAARARAATGDPVSSSETAVRIAPVAARIAATPPPRVEDGEDVESPDPALLRASRA